VSNGQGGWEAVTLLPLSLGANQITATSIGFNGIATSPTATVTEISGTTFSGAGQTQNVNYQAGDGNNTMQWADGVGVVIAGNGNNKVTAGNGADTLQLGNGNNTVTLGNGNDSVTTGSGSDTVTVGNGNDMINVGGGSNKVTVGNGTDTITLGNGASTLALGNGTDTINLGSAANTLTLGAGSYTLTAPSNGGGNELVLTVLPAQLTMVFQSKDKLVFANTGFDLGVDNSKGTLNPQAIASSLFSTSTNGTFTSTSQRFAYNQITGNLYYDAQGNKAGSTSLVVDHLTNDPHLTAANLFFIS
jgi:Ca2+-binding RTX toxin-like protein